MKRAPVCHLSLFASIPCITRAIFHGLIFGIGSSLTAQAQTVSNWTAANPADGTSYVAWNSTTAWSTAPNFPHNGQPSAGNTYRAVIGKVAGQATGPRVDLNRNVTLSQLDFSDGAIRSLAVANPFRQITVSGPFNWTGGMLDENCTTMVNGGITIGQLAGARPTILSGHVLTNTAGQTATHAAGTLQFANTSEILQDAGTFQNNGTFLVTGGLGIDDLSSSSDLENKWVNAGTFTSQPAADVTYAADVFFENTGAVNVTSGTLFLSRGGTATAGSFNVSGGATLRFRGPHTFNAPVTFTGAGILELSMVNGPITPFPDTFTFAANLQFPGHAIISGGTTNWDGNVALGRLTFDRGTLNLTAGTLVTVNGPLRFIDTGNVNSGKLIAGGGGTVEGFTTLNSCELTIPAGATMQSLGNGRLRPGNGGRIVNNGTWEAAGFGTMTTSGTGNQFINSGTLLRRTNTSTTGISVPITNTGAIDVQTGTLQLLDVTSTAGSVSVAAGATLRLQNTCTFNAATPFSGAGSVEFFGGTFGIAGVYNISGTTRVSSGTPTFTGTSTIGTFEQTGGTAVFDGPANISTLNAAAPSGQPGTVTFNVAPSIASLNQTGFASTINFNTSLTVASAITKTGGTLNIATGKTLTLAAPFSGYGLFGGGGTVMAGSGLTFPSGNVELSAATTMVNPAGQTAAHNTPTPGNLILDGGSIFDNRGTFFAQNNRFIEQFASGAGQNFFRNSGTFTRDTATGTYTVEVDFENSGTVNVNTGRLSFASSSNFTQSAGLFRLNGGAVTKSGTSMKFTGGVLTGAGTITGAVDMNGGSLAPNGALTVTGNLTLPAGSALSVRLGGPVQGTDFDFVSEAGNAAMTLGGSLAVTFSNGFQNTITPAQTFTILTSSVNLLGAFSNVASGARLTTADGLGSFVVTYTGTKNVILSAFIANPVAPPPPRITSLTLTAGEVTLTWNLMGSTSPFRVQTSTSMAAGSWTSIGNQLPAGTTTVTFPRPAGPRRYFRLVSP